MRDDSFTVIEGGGNIALDLMAARRRVNREPEGGSTSGTWGWRGRSEPCSWGKGIGSIAEAGSDARKAALTINMHHHHKVSARRPSSVIVIRTTTGLAQPRRYGLSAGR